MTAKRTDDEQAKTDPIVETPETLETPVETPEQPPVETPPEAPVEAVKCDAPLDLIDLIEGLAARVDAIEKTIARVRKVVGVRAKV